MASEFWRPLFRPNADVKKVGYECPWCQRMLKSKVSNSAKNPGRSFVGCSKEYGGCGLFSFLDAEPDETYRPKEGKGADNAVASASAPKRARTEGTNIVGPIVNRPDVTETRLAELATEVAGLRSELKDLSDLVKQCVEN